MTTRSLLRFSSWAACVAACVVACVVSRPVPQAAAADKPAAGPSHQVIACYFHRTMRCPTCQRISAYIEEAVNTRFASQVKDGSVKLVMIDFQDAKNQSYTQAYGIEGPTLVLMDVHGGKVKTWKPAPKVWSLVAQKGDFFKYVQGEVQSYLDGQKPSAE